MKKRKDILKSFIFIVNFSFVFCHPFKKEIPEGKILRLAFKESIMTYDPIFSVDETSGIVLNLLHRNLYTTDLDGKFIPDLAENVIITPGGVYLKIKEGVFFNNPDDKTRQVELTADDVSFCLNRLKESARQPWVLDKIEEVKTYNRYTVFIRIPLRKESDWTRQTYLLSLPQAAIYSKDYYLENGSFVGASKISLFYSDQEKIILNAGPFEIEYKIIPSESGRWFNFKRSLLDLYEADGVFKFMPNQVSNYRQKEVNEAIVFYGAIISKEGGILGNREFRRALNFKLDRENLTKKILLNSYQAADYPVPDILGVHMNHYYNYDKNCKCDYNLKNESVDIYSLSDRDRQLVSKVIKGILSECRVESRIHVVDLATMLKFTNDKRPGIYLLKWTADYPHAENFLIPLFHSKNAGSGGNRSFYKNPEVDRLIDEGVGPDNLEKIEDLIRQDAPWIFIGFSRKTYYVNQGKMLRVPAIYTGWNEAAFGL